MASPAQYREPERLRRPGTRVGICVSRFHEELGRTLLASAKAELERAGVGPEDVRVGWVPGSFELPLVARRLARREDVDCVLCFGIVIQGETTHHHWVAQGAVEGLLRVSLECDKPLALGVLTCPTERHARQRVLPRAEGGLDKGAEVARAAIETLLALDEAARGERPARAAGFDASPRPEVRR
jgi:6,7-dimethyl-8-ribityllumazine synthase